LPFRPFSEPSPIPSSAPTEATPGSIAAIDDVDDDNDNDVVLDGDDGAAAIGSGSPRTICVHGAGDDAALARRD
jgi:hypothetical protein